MAKLSFLDLTVAQITEIETAIGIPWTSWDDSPHPAETYARIYAAHKGIDVDTILSMTLRQLTELVTLEGDRDPSLPSEPEK